MTDDSRVTPPQHYETPSLRATGAPLNDIPNSDWQRFGKRSWRPSDLTTGMYQTMVDIGDGIELCVEAGGNPEHPVLILVMGLGSQMLFWPDTFINRLIEAGFFVIRFDNRDIGLSSKVINKTKSAAKINQLKMMARMQAGLSNKDQPVAYTLHEMAQDTIELIKALNLAHPTQSVHLLGASMGGMIAQLVAATRPDLIDKLVLLFTSTNRAFLLPPKPRQLSTLIKKPASKEQKDIINHGIWFVKTIGSPGFLNEQIIKDKSKLHFERCYYPLGPVQQLNAILATGSIREYSQQITAPTLVLHGSEDGLIPPQHGRDVARNIPNATFKLIHGMGHDLAGYFQPFLVRQICEHLQAAESVS